MTAGALRLWLVLAVQLGCVAPLAIPGKQDGLESKRTDTRRPEQLFGLKGLPRAPLGAPQKKAPQFMLDLFNAVSVNGRTPKSQKEILEGNIVRSFEDKGEQKFVKPTIL